jgi:hypothetical protein
MDQHLPPDSMVFQIPVMEYPESPGPLGSSDHFRPYLYANHLRFSFGSVKGRPNDAWQQRVGAMNSLEALIAKLEETGFGAIYVNRNAFPDKGEKLIQAFKQVGRGDMLLSQRGDLLCIFLQPSSHPVSPDGQGRLYY